MANDEHVTIKSAHPIEAIVHNPVKVTVGVLLVVLFGFVAMFAMPMQLTPEVQIPTITIETRWPGASPQEVEREIVREQEEQLQSVEGVTKMTSESRDSSGSITLEFLVGTDMDEALLKVNSRLQQVDEYPEDAKEPVISTANSSDRPIAWFILSARMASSEQIAQFQQRVRGGNPELAEQLEVVRRTENPGLAVFRLRRLAEQFPEVKELLPADIEVPKLRKFTEDNIEKQLERVPGVSNANVFGGEETELQVVVDPQKLSARRLTITDVRDALRRENQDTSAGDFWEGKRRWVVRTLGRFRSPEQVENQILAIHDGSPVYVRDVAEVRIGTKKPDGLVRRYGTSNIAVNAQRETGANVLDVMGGLQEKVAWLNTNLLHHRGLTLTQVYDETEYIESAIGLVQQNILVGGILTVGVLLLFLRSGRSTLVIGLAIPTSIIGTFLILHALGRSLNVISLAGLAFAVGMLVDNAVVVLENIYRHYQKGTAPFRAAVIGTKEVWGAVIASTLTTLAVFLPVVFIQEEAGQLFRDIALAISSAVALSLVISATLIPMAAARILKTNDQGSDRRSSSPAYAGNGRWSALSHARDRALGRVDQLAGRFVNGVQAANAWIQKGWTRRVVVVAMFFASSALILILLRPPLEYLPSGNRNLVIGIVLPPPGYNLRELTEMGQRVEQELQPFWDVDPNSKEAQQLPFPVIGDFFYVARGRQVFMGLRAADPTRAGELVPLVFSMKSKLPGAIVVANQSSLFEQGLGAGRSIDIEITGPELPKLVGLGGRIMGQLGQVVGGQARPIPSLDLSSPEVHLIPRPMQTRDTQVTATDLGYAVDALIDGAYATDYYIGSDKIDLTITGDAQFVERTQDIGSLPMATPVTDQPVPLSALADVQLRSGPEQVNHRERQRAITIQVTPPPDMAIQTAIDKINAEIISPLRNSGELNDGYTINLSGTADKLRETWDALDEVLLLALLITYLLMAALFESWIYPLVIIISVIPGAVGGVLGLKFLGYYLMLQGQPPQTLDVLTMLGFIILIGTVVNNAILIVHQSLNHIRDERMEPRAAILESVRTRIRPIFMTTATTVFGLAPLVFFPGAGSELYRGLGSVVLGGLIVSTLFTLFLVPTLFVIMVDARLMIMQSLFGVEDELVAVAGMAAAAEPADQIDGDEGDGQPPSRTKTATADDHQTEEAV